MYGGRGLLGCWSVGKVDFFLKWYDSLWHTANQAYKEGRDILPMCRRKGFKGGWEENKMLKDSDVNLWLDSAGNGDI